MEEGLFRCMCGEIIIGPISMYDLHLKMDCPVYAEAHRKLEEGSA